MIQEVLPGLWRISLLPYDALNVYLFDSIVVDTGMVFTKNKLAKALKGRRVEAVALTHAHPDHQGACHYLCEQLKVPLWCGNGDRAAVETGDLTKTMCNPKSMVARVGNYFRGPGHPVSRVLNEGDQVGDFTVIETPGHTPGHISFWREYDRVLVIGDVLFNRNPVTLSPGLQEPFRSVTYNLDINRQSAGRLADLKPAVVCFGHGAPLRNGSLFLNFVGSLQ